MARRTFQVIDVVGVLQHWHAGRPEAVVAASLGGREDGPQVRPSPPRRRGSGRVMTTSWTGPAGRPGVAGGRSTSLRRPSRRSAATRRCGPTSLTPLFWTHVLPYGEVRLDMTARLTLGAGGTPPAG
jgi:hypothetical protein